MGPSAILLHPNVLMLLIELEEEAVPGHLSYFSFELWDLLSVLEDTVVVFGVDDVVKELQDGPRVTIDVLKWLGHVMEDSIALEEPAVVPLHLAKEGKRGWVVCCTRVDRLHVVIEGRRILILRFVYSVGIVDGVLS